MPCLSGRQGRGRMMRLNKKQRDELRLKFGGLCAYCGLPLGDRWHADHFEPIVRSDWWSKRAGKPDRGPDNPERDTLTNLMPACAPCNIDKHRMSLEDWRGQLQRRCGVLSSAYSTYRSLLRFGLIVETGSPIVFHFERAE